MTRLSLDQTRPVVSELALPAALLSLGFSLRPETEEDIPFLLALFGSTREEELAAVPWSQEQKAAFVAMQFNAQRSHYRSNMPDCWWLVLVHDGAPVGRVYLDWSKTYLNLVDIALVPGWRGQGVGGLLMHQIIALAKEEGRGVHLFVERFNAALRLYQRLGFIEVKDTGVHLEMLRPMDGRAA